MLLARFLRPSTSEKKAVLAEVDKGNRELMHRCMKAVRIYARDDDWKAVIAVAVKRAYLSPADIADELGVMRSTVSRWMDGTMMPHQKAKQEMLQKLERAIDKQAS